MSSPNYALIFSPQAELDLENIFLYGIQMWGEEDAEKYIDRLDKAATGLRSFPGIGRTRNDLYVGCKTLHEGSHQIVYHVEVRIGFIDRILHDKMDLGKHINLS